LFVVRGHKSFIDFRKRKKGNGIATAPSLPVASRDFIPYLPFGIPGLLSFVVCEICGVRAPPIRMGTIIPLPSLPPCCLPYCPTAVAQRTADDAPRYLLSARALFISFLFLCALGSFTFLFSICFKGFKASVLSKLVSLASLFVLAT
jgi:hypothetical protein